MYSIVWTLLRNNISKAQLAGYAIANVVGLSVILIGVIFYLDTQQSHSDDQYLTSDYVVVSKRVEGIDFNPISFSDEEIAHLESQPWAMKVGRFTASRFAVSASVEMGGRGMSTYLFLESVPDEFFDVKPYHWEFNPEEVFVPIMLSKDYLTLYNFGFAVPQGLPQISEEVVSAIPIKLRLTGEGQQHEYYHAAVVAFSSRLNTIAVPQSFMDWANNRYSPGNNGAGTSRLIVEVDALSNDAMKDYFASRNWEIAGDDSKASGIMSFLGIVSAVVTVGGVVISLLAMFILVLSIFLLLQKHREQLRHLLLLGYHPRVVAGYYGQLVISLNIIIALVSIIVALEVRELWTNKLLEIGLGDEELWPVMLFTLIYTICITIFDIIIIRRRFRKIAAE